MPETERERRKRLIATETRDWSDEELLAELHRSYDEPTIPPCRLCGAELGLASMGSGQATVYACDGRNEDGSWKPGRSAADEHYSRSQYEDLKSGGDERVIEALRRWAPAPKQEAR
jgi:hypothetical protein